MDYNDDDDDDNKNSLFENHPIINYTSLLKQASSESDTAMETNFDLAVSEFSQLLYTLIYLLIFFFFFH